MLGESNRGEQYQSIVPSAADQRDRVQVADHPVVCDRWIARTGSPLTRRLVVTAGAPSRSRRWSPTRSALAIAVSDGFTALEDGKKLVSTT